ncbi:MAG: AAA family ATPase, partial [Pygmaiobacter sp.]
APLLREWCDTLLFANYETLVVKDGDGKSAKNKAQGGKRVLYTTHHACWDAKNRDGLADKLPFEYGAIAPHIYVPTGAAQTLPIAKSIDAVAPSRIPATNAQTQQAAPPVSASVPASASVPTSTASSAPHTLKSSTHTSTPPASSPVPQPATASPAPIVPQSNLDALSETLRAAGVPDVLRSLMVVDNVEEYELQKVVGERGYFPPDMPVKDYPRDFVDGCLLADWSKVFAMINNNRDLPF